MVAQQKAKQAEKALDLAAKITQHAKDARSKFLRR
jgi:hypothetical protein